MTKRIWIALAVSTAISTVLAILVLAVWSGDFTVPDVHSVLGVGKVVGGAYLLIALPFHLMFTQLGWKGWGAYSAGGAAIGAALGLWLETSFGQHHSARESAMVIATLLAYCGVSGAMLWTLGVRGAANERVP